MGKTKGSLVLIGSISFLLTFPALAFGALSVDHKVYYPPASVNYDGSTGGNQLFLYSSTTSATPICASTSWPVSGNIASVCAWTTSSTLDGYMWIQPTAGGDCTGQSYAWCSTNTTHGEADFMIMAPTGTPTGMSLTSSTASTYCELTGTSSVCLDSSKIYLNYLFDSVFTLGTAIGLFLTTKH